MPNRARFNDTSRLKHRCVLAPGLASLFIRALFAYDAFASSRVVDRARLQQSALCRLPDQQLRPARQRRDVEALSLSRLLQSGWVDRPLAKQSAPRAPPRVMGRTRRRKYRPTPAETSRLSTASATPSDLSAVVDFAIGNKQLLDSIFRRDTRPLPTPTRDEIRACMGSAFLVQLNITHSGMALGVSAYASLMHTLSTQTGVVPEMVAFVLWMISASLAVVIFTLQIVRAFRYPHLLHRDFTSNKYTSFFASPAIVMGGLAITVPTAFHTLLGMRVVFYALLAYQTLLALHWYGDWLFRTGYSLRSVHPTYFMATTEFFILGALGAKVKLDDLAKVSLSVGILFWLLVFVSVFAFLSQMMKETGEALTPTMFLFIAPPATSAIAHMDLQRNVGGVVMDDFTWFFVSVTLFIYLLLIRLFRQYWTRKFSVTWWAYIFPLSTAANLASKVAYEVDLFVPWAMATIAVVVATVMIIVVASLTLRAIAQGKVPYDDGAIRYHYRKLQDREKLMKEAALDISFEIGENV